MLSGDDPRLEGVWCAAMERIAAAAYLVDGNGAVLHANAAGRARLEGDFDYTLTAIRASLRNESPNEFKLTRLPTSCLVVQDTIPTSGKEALSDRLTRATRRWGLTVRQARVLDLVAQGGANKAIAATLGCARNTVEAHLTALFAKAGVDGRAALVARFWTLS